MPNPMHPYAGVRQPDDRRGRRGKPFPLLADREAELEAEFEPGPEQTAEPSVVFAFVDQDRKPVQTAADPWESMSGLAPREHSARS